MSALQERIERGMALLDEKQPGWREKVDVGTLDMSSSAYGLMEQVFGGSYADGLKLLGLTWATAQNYGFDLQEDSDEKWGKLTDAWIVALTPKEVSPAK